MIEYAQQSLSKEELDEITSALKSGVMNDEDKANLRKRSGIQ